MAKAAKKIILTVPGIGRIDSLPGSTFDAGGVARESMVTEAARVHYTEEDMPSKVTFKVPNLPGYFDQLRDIKNVNLNVQDDNGQSWIITDAFTTTPSSLSGGEISIEMAGNAAEKV
jgi:hypothetical protein